MLCHEIFIVSPRVCRKVKVSSQVFWLGLVHLSRLKSESKLELKIHLLALHPRDFKSVKWRGTSTVVKEVMQTAGRYAPVLKYDILPKANSESIPWSRFAEMI